MTRWLKRLGPMPRDADGEAVDVDLPDGSPSPERAAANHELRRAIVEEIRALAPKLRDALLLAQSGEFGYEEIALMTKSPVGTVKWRVSEARRRIKARLVERGFSDVG